MATLSPELAARISAAARRPSAVPDSAPPVAQPASDALAATGRGRLVADLHFGETIAHGGSGWIREATQPSLGRSVAVKTLLPGRRMPHEVDALLRESVVVGRLDHPHIVPVHALGISDRDGPSIVMKRVVGMSWHERIAAREGKPLSSTRVLREEVGITLALCRAVEYAHSRGVLHRDIKPANVMLGAFGEVYLVDWGAALIEGEDDAERRRELAGTPSYLPPEVAEATGEFDRKSDVYLLGASLYHAVTGRLPRAGETVDEVLEAARRGEPLAFDDATPPELARICAKACAPAAVDRYPSAGALREDLVAFLARLGVLATLKRTQARHAAVRQLLASGRPTVASTTRHELATIRFGYEEVLRQWPESAPARAGLGGLLVELVAFELDEGNLAGAVATTVEMAAVPPELAARLDGARRAEAARMQDLAELTEARAQQRLIGATWGRSVTAAATGAAALAAGLLWGWASRIWPALAGHAAMATVALVTAVVTRLVMWRLRRQTVLGSSHYITFIDTFEAMFWVCGAATLLGWQAGLSVSVLWQVHALIGAGIATALAATLDAAFRRSAVLAVFLTILVARWPAFAPDFFGAAFFANGLTLAWDLRPRSTTEP